MGKPKKKRPYTGRDYNMVAIIKGATKAGIHKDQKKEANKTASRSKVELEDEDSWVLPPRCLQCGFPFAPSWAKGDKNELAAMECGYCSVSCMDYDGSSEE